jgi:hypothetical protein
MNIINEIREEIKLAYVEPTAKDLNILALVFLVVPGIVGGLALWKGSFKGWYWIGAGVALATIRLIPPLFRAIYRVWVSMAITVGYFVSRIILTIIFFLVMTPLGLIMALVGKDPMERKIDPEASSYWLARENEKDQSIERYEKQF